MNKCSSPAAAAADSGSGGPLLRAVLLDESPPSYVTEEGRVYTYNPLIHAIHTPFHKSTNIKAQQKVVVLSPTAAAVKDAFDRLLLLQQQQLPPPPQSAAPPSTEDNKKNDNSLASSFVRGFYGECPSEYPSFRGENTRDTAVVHTLEGREYLFPPHSSFVNTPDLLSFKFSDDGGGGQHKYDLVVIDPPWVNKFVRRRKRSTAGYSMSETSSLSSLDVGSLLTPTTLVVIWSTNSPRLQDELKSVLLPAWGHLHLVATWYWLKVATTDPGDPSSSVMMTPVVPFAAEGRKQPYETIFLASPAEAASPAAHLLIPNNLVLVSTPSAIHSQKPNLTNFINSLLLPLEDNNKTPPAKKKRCVELFARSLFPGFRSYGNETIKLNDLSLFIAVDLIKD